MKSLRKAFLLFLFVAAYIIAQPVMTIDSLKGKIELQRAGSTVWQAGKKGDNLSNNDLIRAGELSFAQLSGSDGSTIFVNQNSQMLINFFQNERRNLNTYHFTVFFGAAFFLIKEILPQTGDRDVKVFTPTAIVAIRGTAFSVISRQTDGATNLKVLNGTVLFRNIIRNGSAIVAAGYQSNVTINTDPAGPTLIKDAELAVLKRWVPAAIVKAEIEKQASKSHIDQQIIQRQLDAKVSVVPFANRSSYGGSWGIGQGIAGNLAASLQKATGIPAAAKGNPQDHPLETGIVEKSRYVISGEIRNFDVSQRAKISTSADKYTEFSLAVVEIQMQLFDVAQQKVLQENSYRAEVAGPAAPENSFKQIHTMPFDMGNKAFAGSILGKAIVQCADQAAADLKNYLGNANQAVSDTAIGGTGK